jgi:hypothetical protein
MAKLGGQASYGNGAFVEKITSAKTLTTGDSGKIFTLDMSGGAFSVTLPTASNAGVGWNCKFILTTNGNICTIEPPSTEDTLIGMINSIAGDAGETAESGVDELKFLAAGAAGDHCEIICDGSNFYVSGTAHAADHMSIA